MSQDEKISRNAPCLCGSGLKYKKCCLKNNNLSGDSIKELYYKKYKIRLKEKKDVEAIRKAGKMVLATLDMVEQKIKPGITTEEINTWVHEYTVERGGIPAPLNYHGFPKSVCTSVNEVVCHGIPGDRLLVEGDIINVDVTTILDGYYADANKTFFVGEVEPGARKIVEVAKKSLFLGIEAALAGNTIGDIGWAIQNYAEKENCSVVREFVGHGVGFDFHEAPQIFHYGQRGEGLKLVPGMVFTIEPMINLGRKEIKILGDGWTAITRDKSLTAQFEQTILITKNGPESLTPYQ